MEWILPGTVLSADIAASGAVAQQFKSMFMGGGIMLSQVSAITGLETHDVQNWVKRGFLPAPENKRYNINQLCRIININMLKNVLPMEQICGLLGYINGDLDNTADDLIDDSQLYFMFVGLAAHYRTMRNDAGREDVLEAVLADYEEKIPGAKERVRNVLRIMLTAWAANQLRSIAMKQMAQLEEGAHW
jgi:hypothetical protein